MTPYHAPRLTPRALAAAAWCITRDTAIGVALFGFTVLCARIGIEYAAGWL